MIINLMIFQLDVKGYHQQYEKESLSLALTIQSFLK